MSKKLLSRKSTSEIIVRVVAFTIMFVHCALIIYVFLYGLNASLRWDGRSFMRDPNALAIFTNPEKGIFEPRFENYILAFKLLEDTSYSYFSMVLNSIWYSIGGTLFSLTIAACSTYIVAKYKNKFTRSVFALCLFIMIFPVVGSAPSLYRLYKTLNFDQTPLILLSGLNNLCHLMMYAFFSALSWTYAEAAFIDGASDFQVFYKIMLPMALPSLSVLFVNGVIGAWNDYSTPMLYLNESFPTLASGLFTFENLMKYNSNQPVYFAGVCMAMIPPIILFSVMQNTIMSKVYFGGLKG
ncbi:MAG: carbohydrate ABC transporter permease [Clostridia bacterium]|nr:carbohydrate ABC transporter permease [Clostridia bacterium]